MTRASVLRPIPATIARVISLIMSPAWLATIVAPRGAIRVRLAQLHIGFAFRCIMQLCKLDPIAFSSRSMRYVAHIGVVYGQCTPHYLLSNSPNLTQVL